MVHNIISTIKYLAETNVINFLLMAALLAWIIVKMSVKTSFENGIKNVEDSILKSENEKFKSQGLVKNAQNTKDKLPEEINKIKEISKQKSDTYKKQIEDSTDRSIQNIQNNEAKIFEIEQKKISNELTCETVETTISQSKNNIVEMLKGNPELHLKFISESLDELDKVKI